jgi:predicted GNAT family acetyltransferase
MKGIVDHARTHKLRITPVCGYAVAWFQRNPNARDVLKDQH